MNLFVGTISSDVAYLNPDEIQHCVKVLRKKEGDEILLTNGEGKTIRGTIDHISKKEVKLKVNKEVELKSTYTGLHLAVGLTKNIDRFEYLIEKATELGAAQITPITSHHSERKKANWEKLHKKALSANKQSLRSHFLRVNPIQSLTDFVKENHEKHMLLAHCEQEIARLPLQDFKAIHDPIVLIGPEGDFSKEEINTLLQNQNIRSVQLGYNRLRTETAAVYVAGYFYSLY